MKLPWRPKPPALPTLESVVRERLAVCRARLRKGKGEWPKVGYVRDDVWEAWIREEQTLRFCLREAGLEDEGEPWL